MCCIYLNVPKHNCFQKVCKQNNILLDMRIILHIESKI